MSFETNDKLLKGWHVLVVDDEPDAIEVAATLLEMCGARVAMASNGREALDLIKQDKPQFILSDLSMPVMSGWEMLHELQLNRATEDIPVIALTAHAMPGDRDRAIAAGFHNYLTKPLMPETFVKELLKLLVNIPDMARLLNEGVE